MPSASKTSERVKRLCIPHTWYECEDGKCNSAWCHSCLGELGSCTVCGGAEGQLLPSCPGRRLNEEALDACYHGNVLDLCFFLHFESRVEVRAYFDRLKDNKWFQEQRKRDEAAGKKPKQHSLNDVLVGLGFQPVTRKHPAPAVVIDFTAYRKKRSVKDSRR